MPHKSPFTDWVFEAWDELVLDKGEKLSLEERRRRWRELYVRTYIDGAWVVNVDDAALVSSLGDNLAMIAGEYQVARDLLRQFFKHPDLTEQGLIHRHESLFIREAIADMLCGNVESGAERLRKPLFDANRQKVFLYVVRNDLRALVNTKGLNQPADPLIAKFVADVVGCFKGLKRLSRSLSTCDTYGILNDALEKTFGR